MGRHMSPIFKICFFLVVLICRISYCCCCNRLRCISYRLHRRITVTNAKWQKCGVNARPATEAVASIDGNDNRNGCKVLWVTWNRHFVGPQTSILCTPSHWKHKSADRHVRKDAARSMNFIIAQRCIFSAKQYPSIITKCNKENG